MEAQMYAPVVVRWADGTEVRVVESFTPAHRATTVRPARSFRYAGRAHAAESAWKYLQRRPAQHSTSPSQMEVPR